MGKWILTTPEESRKENRPQEMEKKRKTRNRIRRGSGNTTRHFTPRKRRNNTFQICDRIYGPRHGRKSPKGDGEQRNSKSATTKKSPGKSTPEQTPTAERNGATPMLIDTAQKRRRSTETTEKANKKDGQAKEVPKQPTYFTEADAERATRRASEMIAKDFPEGVTANTLKNAWPETAAAAENQEKQKTNPQNKKGPNPFKTPQGNKLRELNALVEMALDEAERDRNAESWKAPFRKSIIYDTQKLKEEKADFEDTDAGRLLS